jgi:hypothetical protein
MIVTTVKTGTIKHSWVRAPREEWKDLGSKTQTQKELKQGWLDVPFECSGCGCVGHVPYKDGDLPERPEEAINPVTRKVADAYGECSEQLVETIHGQ